MQKKSDAEKNLTPSVSCKAAWRVVSVVPLEDYQISVQFVDGTKGIVDMSALILGDRAGVFESLRDTVIFSQVYVNLGVVSWPGLLDLAPDAMHTELQTTGLWILG